MNGCIRRSPWARGVRTMKTLERFGLMTLKLLGTVALCATALTGGAAQAALINSYDFDGSYADTLGAGNDIVGSGGVISGGEYIFSGNQGLRLTDALPSTTDYAIELGFSVSDSVGGYNKVIDFQDLASDLGLYIYSGALDSKRK